MAHNTIHSATNVHNQKTGTTVSNNVQNEYNCKLSQIREERAAVVEKIPQEPISEIICEQSEVIEVTETASQDRNLQRTVEQTLVDLVEAVKIVLQKRNSERMCEQSEGIEVPKISYQENVEAFKIVPQERISERTHEQIGVSEVPKFSGQESVEAVTIIPQERMSERMCEKIGVIDVPKSSERERILQSSRMVKLGVCFRMWAWTTTRTAALLWHV